MNFRPAPLQIVLAVKRRIAKMPGARLDEKSVRLIAIPKTHFDATVFCFEQGGKGKIIAELDRPDLPHIYAGKTINPKSRKENAVALAWVIAQVGWRILHDPRFHRGNVISLNGK